MNVDDIDLSIGESLDASNGNSITAWTCTDLCSDPYNQCASQYSC
jgi:hypothetical protein